MAGFMTKHMGYVYQGELVNGDTTATENGRLVLINGGKLKKVAAADTATEFVCIEATTIYDGNFDSYLAEAATVPAYRFVVNKLNKPYYFTAAEVDINDADAYNTSTYTTEPGEFLKAHPLCVGEEFITTCVDGTIAVGESANVTATGLIKKA